MSNYCPTYLLLALTLMALGGARSAHAQDQHIYWIGAVQAEDTRGNTIFRYALDTGTVDTLVQAKDLGPEGWHHLFYITVDSLHRQIYWTDSGGVFADGSSYLGGIMRASLDGDNPELFLGPVQCGSGSPSDIELDLMGGVVYWGQGSDCPGFALFRTDLENPDHPELLPVNGNYSVSSIELNIHNQMIYWTNTDDVVVQRPSGILRAPLSDTTSDEYIVTDRVCDIALAHALSKIYWTVCNRYRRIIRRANLDGTEVENVIVSEALSTNSDRNNAINLAIDNKGQKIYWTEPSEGTITRANLDGTEVEELLSGLVVPSSIALSFGGISTAVEPVEEIPDAVELHGLYPNPVEDRANFEFALTATTHVTLEIFDQLGRRVEFLASRSYPRGNFSVAWHPTGQSNGVYFFRLVSGNSSKTIPLVLRR
ncbi:MAG: T9SS type A sorting domain-containing protein [Bacteroidetes bacterium]|nr:T9SS type A sorting domain-containing protein [Bacteroidota bacterium]